MKKVMTNPLNKAHSQSTTPLRLGEILVNQGILKKKDIDKALEIQRQERELQKLPLGEILVESGALSRSNLESLLNHPDLKKQIGALAVEKGLLTHEQLVTCLKTKEPNQLIGNKLVQEGLLRPDQIHELLTEQINAPRLGEMAVRLRFIGPKDLETALKIQHETRKLGEILCDLNLLNPLDLTHILEKYEKQIGLSDLLLSLEYITADQLKSIRQEGYKSQEALGKALIAKKILTKEQLQQALAKQHNVPFRNLAGFVYTEKDKKTLSKIISQKYAENHLILPICIEGNTLTVAHFRPKDMMRGVFELRGMYSTFRISCILITQEKFEEFFEILYSKRLSGLSSDGNDQRGEAKSEDIDFMEINLDEKIDEGDADTPCYGVQDIEAEELVNFIVKYGIVNGASDIHLEQDRVGVKLRYRIDGVLREPNIGWLKKKLREKIGAVVSRIKVMSNLDIAERRLPQDGVFRINYFDKAEGKKFDLDFRVASCRASTGENVTIRILDSRKANIGLENLNHSPHVLKPFKSLLKSSAGMILVCGPTGSGKSSTLYAALQYVYNPGLKIITAEDPIEYSFPGIMQTQTLQKIDLTFARLLRSFLRLDPDIILVGETRDEETAKIAFDAAQTGHLLLSTLHANDAVASVSRLLDLNVEYGQIASSLMCSLAQRLVRRICSSCKKEYIPPEEEWSLLFNQYPSHIQFFKGDGCEDCNFTGYKGRTLLSEIFVVDGEISNALNH